MKRTNKKMNLLLWLECEVLSQLHVFEHLVVLIQEFVKPFGKSERTWVTWR